ncbi:MAG: 2-phosphosulfolactate phosphatase [Solirubrobacteraceae bacterium]
MIDVAMTRADLRCADVTVVIDVLRATSTATQALASGYRRVLCAETVQRARTLRATGRILAGERHCVMPAGFDQGNSPLEAAERRGEELVLATTNGAPTIVAAAACSGHVLLGCLLNFDAVLLALTAFGDPAGLTVQLACSGTDQAVALEDVYVAGRFSARLTGPRTDSARVAEAVAGTYQTPLEALDASDDARILHSASLAADIAYCALESALVTVPVVCAAGDGVAVLTELDRARLAAQTARDGAAVVPV